MTKQHTEIHDNFRVLVHRVDKAAADIGRQLERVGRAVTWHRNLMHDNESCRNQLQTELEQRQTTLQEHRTCIDTLRRELETLPSATEKYSMEQEKENLTRACQICDQQLAHIRESQKNLSLRVTETKNIIRQTLLFCKDQKRRLETLQVDVDEMERKQKERQELIAEKTMLDQQLSRLRDEVLETVRSSVILQCKLRLDEAQRETVSTQTNSMLTQITAAKAHAIFLDEHLTEARTMLDAYRGRWGEGYAALAELLREQQKYKQMIDRLLMENADMETKLERARAQELVFDGVVRADQMLKKYQKAHSDAIFDQFVLQCHQ